MILIVDLEATCDDMNSIPPADMEIIEVGAVWALPDGQVLEKFQTLVRPVLNPVLTPYCMRLLGIRQDEVDTASAWPDAAAALCAFAMRHADAAQTWGSWGQFDFRQIARDCNRHGIHNPLSELSHINLKRQFAKARKMKEVGMVKALELTHHAVTGTHHRGLDDAINIAKLLPWCL